MPEFMNEREQVSELAREQANAWIARFAPLVLDTEALTASEIRERLALLDKLQIEAAQTKDDLFMYGTVDDRILRSTLERAISQIDSLETDLRKRLGRVAPGDPNSIADLDKLNERLEERLARQEIGVETDVPATLEIRSAPANYVAALFIGLFGLGWTSFTTVHAFFMIGGLARQFGPVAFALLLFYSIFFLVGFGMLAAAFAAASGEDVEVNGRTLTNRRKFAGINWKKTYTIASGCQPKMEIVTSSSSNGNGTYAVVLVDPEGKPIHVAKGASEWQRKQVKEKLTAYLAAHP